jgi:hypothetical protein
MNEEAHFDGLSASRPGIARVLWRLPRWGCLQPGGGAPVHEVEYTNLVVSR